MLISNKPSNDGILSVFQKIPSDLTDKAETIIKVCRTSSKEKIKSRRPIFWATKIIRTCYGINE